MEKEQAVWAVMIVRRDRDWLRLVVGYEIQHPQAVAFVSAIDRWFDLCHSSKPKRRPICLTCKHAFKKGDPPMAFAVAYSEDPRVRHAIVTGVCERCSEQKTDDDLLNVASPNISKMLDGYIVGPVTIPPPARLQ